MDGVHIKPTPRWAHRVLPVIYGAVWTLGEPLVWRYLARRAKRDPDYALHLDERRGKGETFKADLWVHAVSLGEFKSAEPLIGQALASGHKVLVTHLTPAARRASESALAAPIAAGRVAVRYMPMDRPRYWAAFHRLYQPKVGLIMEMEFWPALIEAARRANCWLCLANSQVPAKSFPRARRVARLFGHPVASAAAVFAKSPQMAERFEALGATPVHAMGETRFDIPPPQSHLAAAEALVLNRPVLTLASVVAGEEHTYIQLLHHLFSGPQPPLIFWVPRAPEKFDDHVAELREAGFKVARRSDVFDADLKSTASLDDVQVLVGDSLGEMFFYLAPAKAVIVGGGFVKKGAHNVIEPLSLGKPVVTGPYVWTIEYPGVEAQEAGVLTVVPTAKALPDAVHAAMAQDASASAAFHAANAGASRRIFAAIQRFLEASE